MVKKKYAKYGIVLFLLLLAMIGVGYLGGSMPFSITGNVLIPQFGHIACISTDKTFSSNISIPRGETSLICGAPDTPFTENCYLDILFYQQWWRASSKVDVWKCTDKNNDNTCSYYTTIDKYEHSKSNIVSWGMNEKIKLKTGLLYSSGQATAIRHGYEYGLVDVGGDGFVKVYASCNLNQIAHYIISSKVPSQNLAGDSLKIGLQYAINYVAYSSPVPSESLKDLMIKDGKDIYVIAPATYYPIVTAKDGTKYVDSSTPLIDNSIECRPSNVLMCNADATLKETFDPSGQTCSALSGGIVGWPPNKDDASQVCTIKCISGKLQHDQCKEIPDCTTDKPVLTSDYNCIGLTPLPIVLSELPAWFVPLVIAILILIGAVVIGYVVYSVAKRR